MKKGLRTDFGPRQSPPSVASAGSRGPAGPALRYQKAKEGVRHEPRPYRERDSNDEDVHSDNLPAVNDRLDDLRRQTERLTQDTEIRPSGNESHGDRMADTLARFDRRLEQVIEGRARPAHAAQAALSQEAPPSDYRPMQQ